MTASKAAKAAGFSSLTELVQLTEVPRRTLSDWNDHNQKKFQLAIDAAKYRKGKI